MIKQKYNMNLYSLSLIVDLNNAICPINWRASVASETLTGNTIENCGCLFIY